MGESGPREVRVGMISSRWLCEEDGNQLCGLPWFQEGQLEVCKELAGDTGKWRSWPDTKRTGKVSRVGEFPGELEACKESSILSLPSPPFISRHGQSRGERVSGSLGSHSSQVHQGEFLGLKAVWQGPLVGLNTTAAQCKTPPRAQVSIPAPQPDLVP